MLSKLCSKQWIKIVGVFLPLITCLQACYSGYYVNQAAYSTPQIIYSDTLPTDSAIVARIGSYRMELLPEDSAMAAFIAPYKADISKQMDVVIGEVDGTLTHSRSAPESTLGNWACDAMMLMMKEKTNEPIDFCVINKGGLRIPELRGSVTIGRIYELMPFDNALTTVTLDSAQVIQFFQHIAANGGWPVSKEISAIMDKDNKTLINVSIHKEAVRGNRTYTVLVSDYIANGGDNCFFLQGLPRQSYNFLMRDALLKAVMYSTQQGEKIHAQLDNRMFWD